MPLDDENDIRENRHYIKELLEEVKTVKSVLKWHLGVHQGSYLEQIENGYSEFKTVFNMVRKQIKKLEEKDGYFLNKGLANMIIKHSKQLLKQETPKPLGVFDQIKKDVEDIEKYYKNCPFFENICKESLSPTEPCIDECLNEINEIVKENYVLKKSVCEAQLANKEVSK